MYTQLSRKWQSLKIIKVIDNLINSLFSAGNEDSRKIRAIKCTLNGNNARYCRNHMDSNDQQSTFLCCEYLRLNFLCFHYYQGILRVCVTHESKIDANIYEYHSFFINTRHWLIEEHFLWIPFSFGQGEKTYF